MPQSNPQYLDGLQAVNTLSVYCYNNAATYMCFDGDPSIQANQTEFADSDNAPLGSFTNAGFRKGTLNLQYNLATDELPGATNLMQPGFILSFRGRYYVAGTPTENVVKNDVIKFSVAVLELQNPFIANLLSTLGQQVKVNINANINTTVNCVATGARTGSTVTYTVETFATPGSAAPSGVTINANTGVLTLNVTAGAYDVRVIALDTSPDSALPDSIRLHYGWGRYTPTAV
jgi:hypothetical protein